MGAADVTTAADVIARECPAARLSPPASPGPGLPGPPRGDPGQLLLRNDGKLAGVPNFGAPGMLGSDPRTRRSRQATMAFADRTGKSQIQAVHGFGNKRAQTIANRPQPHDFCGKPGGDQGRHACIPPVISGWQTRPGPVGEQMSRPHRFAPPGSTGGAQG